eukprot:CCRYP_007256-RB/>CCRYP_007256-RB protein AED:0.45 eAED:0.45 QI:0/0/0/1/0/0/2/0/100
MTFLPRDATVTVQLKLPTVTSKLVLPPTSHHNYVTNSFPKPKSLWTYLAQSNATPTISAYAHLCDPFDYDKRHLAPLGCNVQVHEKTDQRGTWAFHSFDG